MRTYDKYKDSGVEWIGEIPEDWYLSKIKYLPSDTPLSFIDGDWIESKDIVFDERIRYITTGNIGEGVYKEQGHSFITEETFKNLNCTEVFEGDLLISRLNRPIGRSCLIPDLGYRIVTSVDNVIFRPKESMHKGFLNFLMNSSKYFDYTELIARGATMQRISRGLLSEIKLPIPSLQEQTLIANYLTSKTTEIDQTLTDKEALINLYEEEKKALINEAVTKGLNSKVKFKPSGIDWLGDIPEHWEVKKLKNVSKNIQTGKTPSTSNEAYFISEDYNWFTPGDFGSSIIMSNSARKISQLAVNDEGLKLFEEYTILLVAIGATLGKIGIVTDICFANQQINSIAFNHSQILPFFGAYFLENNSEMIKKQSVASTLAILNQEKTKELLITVPPIKEQTIIIEHIENETSKINEKIALAKQEIELLKEFRQALIFEAVTGKICVQ